MKSEHIEEIIKKIISTNCESNLMEKKLITTYREYNTTLEESKVLKTRRIEQLEYELLVNKTKLIEKETEILKLKNPKKKRFLFF